MQLLQLVAMHGHGDQWPLSFKSKIQRPYKLVDNVLIKNTLSAIGLIDTADLFMWWASVSPVGDAVVHKGRGMFVIEMPW